MIIACHFGPFFDSFMYLARKNQNFKKSLKNPNRKLHMCTIYPTYWMFHRVDIDGVVEYAILSHFLTLLRPKQVINSTFFKKKNETSS